MSLAEYLHERYVQNRRVRLLAHHLTALIGKDTTILDVGCGDGSLAARIFEVRVDARIKGIDVLARNQSHIPVDLFDGQTIPHSDRSFDVVMLVDVLHHTEYPMVLLREAKRVARRHILIKDHLLDRPLAGPTLRFMDCVGNARYGVSIPHNYWPERKWREAFEEIGLEIAFWKKDLQLYPRVLDLFFGGSLHFIAQLDVNPSSRNQP
jgi:SAM-dependent methyltransferase